ncbi:MAG: polyprenyl synthetase family protein [Nitrospina sp.]|jgi:octaprenyl-diphosphate synthase|nr:polyprenyl synthetase family protein [Nitrospina sp.]MBT6601670.1 polyprenyl synthetase family protein [Nitrospina sp.]
MDFNEVTRIFKDDLSRVENSIQENYQSDVPLIPGIGDYLLKNGGKRIRPLLLMVGTKLCAGNIDERVIRHCSVVEYIHSATLLHDDVVDETTVRRGRQTVNAKWGSDASILVGDFLISRSILMLASDCDSRIINSVSQATKLLVEGGIMEYSQARKLSISESHCLDVILRKTAAMMSLCCELAALLSEANPEQEKALINFGTQFGMAFQLMDDAMDYNSEEDSLGKPPGNDFQEGHVTLPLLHLYENSEAPLKKRIGSFIENKNLTPEDFDYVLERMRETKSVEYTLELARHYLEQAKSSIRSVTFPNPDFIKSFDAIADYIYERALIQS